MIQLTDTQIAIMGRPNFACAQVAKILIDSGEYAKGPKKAEYEQAVYIHWAMNLRAEHGDHEWKAVGNKILKSLRDKITEGD